MEKKLPSIFANKIEKELTNNERVYVSNKEKEVKEQEPETKENKNLNLYEKTIGQKINEILKSKKSLYKIPVKITMNNQETIKYIIGKNTKSLITIENELIQIEEIKDIKIYEE